MTDPVFGRIYPIHFFMLDLACWHDPDREDPGPGMEFYGWPEIPHEDKIRQIIQKRADLFYWTEHDCGFSLQGWRRYLMGQYAAGEEHFGYGYPGFAYVDAAVQTVINDPGRIDLEAEAARRETEFPLEPEIWWPGENKAAVKEARQRRKTYDWEAENRKYADLAATAGQGADPDS